MRMREYIFLLQNDISLTVEVERQTKQRKNYIQLATTNIIFDLQAIVPKKPPKKETH